MEYGKFVRAQQEESEALLVQDPRSEEERFNAASMVATAPIQQGEESAVHVKNVSNIQVKSVVFKYQYIKFRYHPSYLLILYTACYWLLLAHIRTCRHYSQ